MFQTIPEKLSRSAGAVNRPRAYHTPNRNFNQQVIFLHSFEYHSNEVTRSKWLLSITLSSSRVALRRSFHRKCKSIRKRPTKFDADSFKFFIPSKWAVNQLSAHLRHLIWILTQMQPKLKGPFWTMMISWLVPSSSISRKLLFILAAGCVMCCTHATFLDDGTIEKLLWAGIWSRDWESLAERSGTLSITLLIT